MIATSNELSLEASLVILLVCGLILVGPISYTVWRIIVVAREEKLRNTPGTTEWLAEQARLRALAEAEQRRIAELRAEQDRRYAERSRLELEERLRQREAQRRRDEHARVAAAYQRALDSELDSAAMEAGRYITDWQSAERASLLAMRELGFADAELTAPGADAGVDVISTAAVAQVKRLASKVGRPDVQKLKGAAGNRTAVFYAVGDRPYTRQAIEFADSCAAALFALSQRGDVTAFSAAADRLLARAHDGNRAAAPVALADQPQRLMVLGAGTVPAPAPAPAPSTSPSATAPEPVRARARAGDHCSCGGTFTVRHRRRDGGKFLGCSRYPRCTITQSL
jgi:hypothetical protein